MGERAASAACLLVTNGPYPDCRRQSVFRWNGAIGGALHRIKPARLGLTRPKF